MPRVRDRQCRRPPGVGLAVADQAAYDGRAVVATGAVLAGARRRSGSASVWVAAPWQYVIWGTCRRDRDRAVELPRQPAVVAAPGPRHRPSRRARRSAGGDRLRRVDPRDHRRARRSTGRVPSGITAVLGFAAVSMLAWIFFGYATSAVERGLRRLQLRGSVNGLRDTVMYLPFLLDRRHRAVRVRPRHCGGRRRTPSAGRRRGLPRRRNQPLLHREHRRITALRRPVVGHRPVGSRRHPAAVAAGAAVGRPSTRSSVVAASVVLIAVLVALNEINARRVQRSPGCIEEGATPGRDRPSLFVPVVGLEPTRPFGQSILSAPRLPFRHTGRSASAIDNTVGFTCD